MIRLDCAVGVQSVAQVFEGVQAEFEVVDGFAVFGDELVVNGPRAFHADMAVNWF